MTHSVITYPVILPCPSCEGRCEFNTQECDPEDATASWGFVWVSCTKCKLQLPPIERDIEKAIKQWNALRSM